MKWTVMKHLGSSSNLTDFRIRIQEMDITATRVIQADQASSFQHLFFLLPGHSCWITNGVLSQTQRNAGLHLWQRSTCTDNNRVFYICFRSLWDYKLLKLNFKLLNIHKSIFFKKQHDSTAEAWKTCSAKRLFWTEKPTPLPLAAALAPSFFV